MYNCLDAAHSLSLVLQAKIGRGEYNKATTKVLHFKRNPAALAEEKAEQGQLAKLEAENASLKAQLEKSDRQQSDAGPSEASSVQSAVKAAEITILQRQVSCTTSGAVKQHNLYMTWMEWDLYREHCDIECMVYSTDLHAAHSLH